MQTLPEILGARKESAQVAIELRVPAGLEYFRGHFPRYPILPGVVQLAWAADMGVEYLRAGTELVRIEALKFSRVIRPDDRLFLVLEWSAQQRCLAFRYTYEGIPCSSGRFIFAS